MAHDSIFNLAEFDQDVIKPELTDFVKANSNRARAYGFANMVSAYFWMVLGLDAGYFPAGHTQSLFAQRFDEFFGHFEDLFKTWGHIFDPEFAPLLHTAISHRTLSQRQERLPSNEISRGALRTSLLAESRFLRDREGSAFVSLLNFDPELLDDIIQHNRTREGIADVVLDRDALARGFQSVWIYMETLIELSSTLQQENAPFSKRLDARLRQLTRWRVNKHLGVDEHFTKVALFVNERYCGEILDDEQVEHRAERLLGAWGFTHLKVVSATG